MTTIENKKYNDLLDVLAEFIKVEGDPAGLDPFLSGYAGKDWARAKAAARPYVSNHRLDDKEQLWVRWGGRWLTFDDLVDALLPDNPSEYDESQAEADARRMVEDHFDRLEFEVVGYQRPIHF